MRYFLLNFTAVKLPLYIMVYSFFNTFCNKTSFCFLLPNVECPLGYFGKGCTEHCSGHCIKGEPCDHISGECTNGCQDGYTGVRCSDCKKMK